MGRNTETRAAVVTNVVEQNRNERNRRKKKTKTKTRKKGLSTPRDHVFSHQGCYVFSHQGCYGGGKNKTRCAYKNGYAQCVNRFNVGVGKQRTTFCTDTTFFTDHKLSVGKGFSSRKRKATRSRTAGNELRLPNRDDSNDSNDIDGAIGDRKKASRTSKRLRRNIRDVL